MRLARTSLAVLGVAASALVARGASAAEPLSLVWNAPAGCPREEEVRQAALGAAAADVVREPLEAEVHIDRGERWTARIRTRRGGVRAAERHLEAASCSALADATAVILASALISEAEPRRKPVPAPTTSAGPPIAPEPDGQQPDAAPDAFVHALAASASLATIAAALPSAALAGRAALAWTPSRARIELGGTYSLAQSKTTGSSEAGATFSLLGAGVRGCLALARFAAELSTCAGAELTVVNARGFGASRDYEASAVWMSAAAGALLRIPLASWLAVRADGDALVPLSRPRFVVEGDAAVYRPAAFGARGAIGAEVLFL